MTCEDQVFVANVVVINLMWKMVIMNVISWPTGIVMKFNVITKICKYKRFHERHHFIPMAMEVNSTLECDIDHFIKECALFFHDKWWKGHLSLFFCIQFFK
jgi:hypothetical protein